MERFITIPSNATGFATPTVPGGGPIQLPVEFLFDVKQISATVTEIYFDNRLGVGQKKLAFSERKCTDVAVTKSQI
jgi:hypothetical protein